MKKILLIFLSVFAFVSAHAEITWELSDDGTLTISGTNMPDYSYRETPWYSQKSKIKKVEIKEGVTSIGNCAFYECKSLTSVTIPNSVTSIGMGAFNSCYNLTSITIPNSVTSIGEFAFWGCSGLTSITIPNSVTSIGDQTFQKCSCLTSVTIPNSVTSIGNYAFNDCSSLTSITIPNSVTSIEEYAFYSCSSLTSLTIPNSVTSIGEHAFRGCNDLTSVIVENGNIVYDSRNNCNALIETSTNTLILGCQNTIIPNSVTNIENGAFRGCSGLTSITIPNSVTSIGESAFSECRSLTSVTIGNSVTSIGSHAFFECKSLTSITIPNSVKSIGHRAFYDCCHLKSITISKSVSSLGEYVFNGCVSVETVTVEEGNKVFDSRNNCNAIIRKKDNTLIFGCRNTQIPNNVTCLGTYAFERCVGLSSINIPASVKKTEEYPFASCYILKDKISNNSNIALEGLNIIDEEQEDGLLIKDNIVVACRPWATQITVPQNVIKISSLYGCNCVHDLKTIIINANNNLTFTSLFDDCNVNQIIIYGETMPKCRPYDDTFDYDNTILYVPASLYNDYSTTYPWSSFKHIVLIEDLERKSIILDDSEIFNNSIVLNSKDINYTRTFNNTSWQALYIPFSMTYDDWKDDFEVAYINGIRQMDTDDDGAIDETIMDVVKIKSGSLIPNTPYLIKAKTTGNKTITVNNATLNKSEENSVYCSTTIAKYTFTGTYNTISASTLLANNYYAMGGGSLIMTDGTSDLKPFRWYLNVESRSPMYNVSNGAKTITINVIGEEEATGISQMSSGREHSSAIYDLNGRKMSQKTLKSGLYIKNGKKIIIK